MPEDVSECPDGLNSLGTLYMGAVFSLVWCESFCFFACDDSDRMIKEKKRRRPPLAWSAYPPCPFIVEMPSRVV